MAAGDCLPLTNLLNTTLTSLRSLQHHHKRNRWLSKSSRIMRLFEDEPLAHESIVGGVDEEDEEVDMGCKLECHEIWV
jgi:hypothetical protein